jgi:hypothetical protein
MIYYILGLLIFFYALYSISLECANGRGIRLLSRWNVIVLLCILIILSGLRWETGADWQSYYIFFKINNTWNEYKNGPFEILYAFLNYAVKTLFNSYSIFLLILGISTIVLKYASIEKVAVYPALTFFYIIVFISEIFFRSDRHWQYRF